MQNLHLLPTSWPHPSLAAAWAAVEAGEGPPSVSTQPWVSALLYQFIRACDYRRVAELGAYQGITSCWLALAIEANGGGILTLVDTQPLETARERLSLLGLQHTQVISQQRPSRDAELGAVQFVFIDDDKASVVEHLKALRDRHPLVAIHDAEGIGEDLSAFGGFRLPCPTLWGSGQLAIMQL